MKKVTLIHSYSDRNKGDLGILLGTINTIKNIDPNVEINCVSTFEYDDPFFKSDHDILRKHVKEVFPAIVGRLYSKSNSKIVMVFKLLKDLVRMMLIYLMPFNVFKRFIFDSHELRTLELIMRSDLVISKGGSFICTTNRLTDKLRLFRLMTILVISLKLKKKVVILAQSIGPSHGYFSNRLINYIMRKCKVVVLREDMCVRKYTNLKFPQNTIIAYDMAFNMALNDLPLKAKNGVIGMTIVRFLQKDADKNYSNVLRQIIEYIIEVCGKKIHIVPHVMIGDDLTKAKEIISTIRAELKADIFLDENYYTPNELHKIYNSFDLLIGTRLHSTIFALNVATPVINISYHGTKAEGVFSRVGIGNNVLNGEQVTFENIRKIIDNILSGNYTAPDIGPIRQYNNEVVRQILSEVSG